MFSEYLVGLNSGLTALLALLQGHSSPATTACQLLQEQIPSAVFFQGMYTARRISCQPLKVLFLVGSDIYAAAVHHNSLSSQQNATCVVEPSTPEEVSTVVSINYNSVRKASDISCRFKSLVVRTCARLSPSSQVAMHSTQDIVRLLGSKSRWKSLNTSITTRRQRLSEWVLA